MDDVRELHRHFFLPVVAERIRLLHLVLLPLLLAGLLLFAALVGVVGGGDVDDFLHNEGVVLDVLVGRVGVEGELLEDLVEHLGVDFVGDSGLLGPLGVAFLELGADFLEELAEYVFLGELVEGLLGIVGAIQYVNLHELHVDIGGLRVRQQDEGVELVAVAPDAVHVVAELGFLQHVLQEQQLETIQQQFLSHGREQLLNRKHKELTLLLVAVDVVRMHRHFLYDQLYAVVEQVLLVLQALQRVGFRQVHLHRGGPDRLVVVEAREYVAVALIAGDIRGGVGVGREQVRVFRGGPGEEAENVHVLGEVVASGELGVVDGGDGVGPDQRFFIPQGLHL